MKIVIIGAGPAGNYAAYLLAKKGHDVCVYEKNVVIGSPVQCTGILSEHFLRLMEPSKKFVMNTVNKTRIYAPNQRCVQVTIKPNYVICRKKFDIYLADIAKSVGVKYYLGHTFKSYKKEDNIICTLSHLKKEKKVEADILIGADGPLSNVAKSAGLFSDREYLIGTQIEARLKNDNVVEFYPYLGSYAWVVPVNKNTVRIGVAAKKDSVNIFKKFAHKKLGKDIPSKTIENQSGIIPIFDPKIRLQREFVYLLGDAATFVKATSGGGINQGLVAAKILTDSIDNNMSYQKNWKKEMFLQLYVHLLAHKMHSKFSDEDWNYLIMAFSSKQLKDVLSTQSRDNIVKMMAKICIRKPQLVLKYLKYFPFDELTNIF